MLKFAPIMPAFCLLLLYSYYANNFAGEIDGSLTIDEQINKNTTKDLKPRVSDYVFQAAVLRKATK